MGIIRVMTYNVGHYNMGQAPYGFPPELMDEKAGNLKTMLMASGPDIIGTQEDSPYADQAQTIKASTELYAPVWQYRPNNGGSNIRAKFPCYSGTAGTGKLSSGANYRKAILKVDGNRLMVVSVHATAHQGNSAKRLQDYREIFDIVKAETWKHAIITGDFNTLEDTDKTNLKVVCSDNNFSMAIGDYLPWLNTYIGRSEKAKRHSFDNILVSSGLTIRTTNVLSDWWGRLYSDHVPLICDIC